METKFNSQICTSREQSERLLALGLKKETADCCYYYYDGEYLIAFAEDAKYPSDIPAWSLHRLWELGLISKLSLYEEGEISKIYDIIIGNIELQIKEGYFNKEYLVCENGRNPLNLGSKEVSMRLRMLIDSLQKGLRRLRKFVKEGGIV